MGRPKFSAECADRQTISIAHPQVFLMVDLDLPEEIREHLPASEIQHLHGVFCLGFHHVPQVGTTLCYMGHCFEVRNIEQSPTLYRSKMQKLLPVVKTHYLGVDEK